MNVKESVDEAVSRVAAAIGEPARTKMLFCLMDGHARTSTELAIVAEVTPSTASVHLNRLKEENLVKVVVQGRHRYYRLGGPHVARVLEKLSVVVGGGREKFVPHTPSRLRAARSCYDHMAGALAVGLHDRFHALRWVKANGDAYDLTAAGATAFEVLGIDVEEVRTQRRRFAYACLDWSERRPHVGGALGASVLKVALARKWVVRELDSRALEITAFGRREMRARFGLEVKGLGWL